MSYVPNGQLMVDSAAERIGCPSATMITAVASNMTGKWGAITLSTSARARRLKLARLRVIHHRCFVISVFELNYGGTCIGPGLLGCYLCPSKAEGVQSVRPKAPEEADS